MGEVVAREVEVVSNPSVPVVGHGAPVLSASLSTRSCVAHFSHILRRFSLADFRPMGAGDVVAHVIVLAGEVLLDWPGLACQVFFSMSFKSKLNSVEYIKYTL